MDNLDGANKLGRILKETGWSQVTLARKLKVSQKTLSFWLSGKTMPSEVSKKLVDTLYSKTWNNAEKDNPMVKHLRGVLLETQAGKEFDENDKQIADSQRQKEYKVKILRDNDKRERFTHGVVSIHWLQVFAENMKGLGYLGYREKSTDGHQGICA